MECGEKNITKYNREAVEYLFNCPSLLNFFQKTIKFLLVEDIINYKPYTEKFLIILLSSIRKIYLYNFINN